MKDKDYPSSVPISSAFISFEPKKKEKYKRINKIMQYGFVCNHDDYILCNCRIKYLKKHKELI